MKICTKCVLPETFPNIRFNDEGVCSFCQDFKGEERLEAEKMQYLGKFNDLIKQVAGKRDYDCTLSYSGGKDSTYTLYLLKEIFKLKVLSITFDNGFVSDQALKNIRIVSDNLGVDNMIFKADFQLLKKLFRAGTEKLMYPSKALERASTICNSCIAFVKFTSLKIALEKKIPIMAWGWSPGQAPIRSSIMKMTPALFKSTQEMYRKPMYDVVGEEINRYFLSDGQFEPAGSFPYNVNPLAFMEYNEKLIITKIEELGWLSPKDVDHNSTNCLLNAFANQVHLKKHSFHPYAFELAGLIRSGLMSREDGMRKLSGPETAESVRLVLDKLGMKGMV